MQTSIIYGKQNVSLMLFKFSYPWAKPKRFCVFRFIYWGDYLLSRYITANDFGQERTGNISKNYFDPQN